jgi:hypothetical protein
MYVSGIEVLQYKFHLKKTALTLFIVTITTHKKWLVKTIIRLAFCTFFSGISLWVQENANIMF